MVLHLRLQMTHLHWQLAFQLLEQMEQARRQMWLKKFLRCKMPDQIYP